MSKKRSEIFKAQEEERKEQERQKQLEEERKRNLKRKDDEIKQQTLRVAVLTDSVKEFEGLVRKIMLEKKQNKEKENWDSYVNCDKLNYLDVPANVRDFMSQWQSSLHEHWGQQYNWWLQCDDRSVLTQDQREDTRRILMKKLREKTGNFYDKKLRALLKVYNRLLDFLKRKKMAKLYYDDLITIRDEIREMVVKFLDILTFEVTMHIDREMETINSIMAQYSYASPDFINFIWSFKDVPLPKNYPTLTSIKMDPLQMKVAISNLIDLNSTVVRGLWLKQDFFSDFCSSFNPPFDAKYIDFKTAVMNEWIVKKSMTEKHLTTMKKAREDFEEKIEKKRQEEESKKKKSKKSNIEVKKKPSKVKFKEEPEPPIVDEATYIDVDDEFIRYEENLIEEERESCSPESLQLLENEINLREHQITNGVFKIECFERPSQTKEINFQLFLRPNENPHTIKNINFHHVYQPPNVQDFMTRKGSVLARSGSVKLAEARENALADLIKVEIKLSEKVFWWEEPKVCRWEPWEESDEFAKLEAETQDFNLNFDKLVKTEAEKLFSAPDPRHYKKKIQVTDFDLTSHHEHIDRSVLAKHFLVPMMPVEFKFFHDQLKIFEVKHREWRNILIAKQELNESETPTAANSLRELFEQTWKEFDVSDVTLEKFKAFFNAKSFTPRNLFPREYCQLIKALDDPTILKQIKEDREVFRKQNEPNDTEDVDIGEPRPMRNEPVALSELLEQIKKVEKSLQPFLWKVQEFRDSNLPVNEASVKPQKRISKLKQQKKFNRTSQKLNKDQKQRKLRRSTRQSTFSSRASSAKPIDESSFAEEIEEPSKLGKVLVPHNRGSWSTRDIYEPSYDAQTKVVTFYTGSLGTFGFATRKYCNLPFLSWEIFPVTEESKEDRFVVMRVVTQNVTIEFKITNLGYTLQIINKKKVPFEAIKNPVKINELKKVMTSLNVNIFPEIDAYWYVDKISEKHKGMEFHTYKSMAVYCLSHHFKSNAYNRWAHHRVALFESRMIDKAVFTRVMASPMRTASVFVREKCTPLDVVELDYDLLPADQEFHPDLLNFLKTDVYVQEHRKNLENYKMIWFVQTLLLKIRPLSFSE